MIQHQAPISGLSLFEQQYIATAGYDNQIILWNAQTRQPLQRGWHDHLANYCDFSPDGSLLVTASSDGSTRLWSVPEFKLQCVMTSHSDDVMQAKFSPDGEKIASCSYDSSLSVHHKDGSFICKMQGHSGLVESFDWTADSLQLLSCGTDGTIRAWDAATGECLAIKETEGHDMDALVTLSAGVFIVGNNDGELQVINCNTVVNTYKGHRSSVKKLVKSKFDNSLLSLGYDGIAVLWSIEGQTLVEWKRSEYPKEIWARSAEFQRRDKIYFATFGSTFAIWDIARNHWDLEGFVPSASLNSVHAAEGVIYSIGDAGLLKADGKDMGGPQSLCNFVVKTGPVLVCGGQTGQVFDVLKNRVVYAHHAPLNCGVNFKLDGEQRLAVGSYSGDIIIFKVNDRHLEFVSCHKIHENAIKGISLHGNCLYTGCADGEIGVTDIRSYEVINKITHAHEGILNDLCSYASGVATVSRDLTLKLWGEPRAAIPSRHTHSIKCIASNDDGNFIATGSYGGTVDIYDCTAREWLGNVRKVSAAGISSLTWDDEKQRFLASSYDGRIYAVELG